MFVQLKKAFSLKKRKENRANSTRAGGEQLSALSSNLAKNKYLKKILIGFYVSKLAGALLAKTPIGELGPRGPAPPSLPDLGRNRTGRTRARNGEDGQEADVSKAAMRVAISHGPGNTACEASPR